MDSSIGLVSFVTRAENRITVLDSLSSGSLSRQDLQTETEIPRATLSRILADFQRRKLVTRNNHQYEATPLGYLIASELASLFASVESMTTLQTLAGWLPLDDLAVDFDRLAAADVTLPTPIDPLSPVKRAAAVVGDAEHVRTFCYSVVHAPILAALQAVSTKSQRLEGVIARGVLEVVSADPDLAGAAQELFESGRAELYIYDEGIEPQLIIADGTTMFLVTDDEGAIKGLVETDDEAILLWSEKTFESLKDEAEPLRPEAAAELLTS